MLVAVSFFFIKNCCVLTLETEHAFHRGIFPQLELLAAGSWDGKTLWRSSGLVLQWQMCRYRKRPPLSGRNNSKMRVWRRLAYFAGIQCRLQHVLWHAVRQWRRMPDWAQNTASLLLLPWIQVSTAFFFFFICITRLVRVELTPHAHPVWVYTSSISGKLSAFVKKK